MTEKATATQTKGRVQVGDVAPDFTLPDQSGTPVRLHDVLNTSHVVVFFYPKDNSAGCTAEACAFRDQYEVFKDAGAEVIGISADSKESHQAFMARHRLPFTLLTDADGAIRKRYGATTLGVLPGRVTYVIGKDGVVRHVFSSAFNMQRHITESLQALRTL